MSGKTRLEVVMECNIMATTRIDQSVWTPCATSTPLRKPLAALTNAAVLDNSSKGQVIPPKAVLKSLGIEKGEGKCPRGKRNNDGAKEKSNKNSRILHRLDDDDSEDEKADAPAKPLIIKFSTNQFNKKSLRKRKPVMETDSSSNDEVKDNNGHDDSLQPVKVSDSETEKCNGNKNLSPHQTQKSFAKDAEVKETSKNLSTPKTCHKISKSGKSTIKLADIPEKLSNSVVESERNGVVAPQKRKNKNIEISQVKKLKSESHLPVSSLKKSSFIKDKVKKNEKTAKLADIIRKRKLGRLSVSHEIFSDSKEREFRDSLDLTAGDQEELPIGDVNDIKLPIKHKNLSKWKSASSRQSVKSEPSKKCKSDNVEVSRPRRTKKPPKEFWLPESEKNSRISPGNNNDAEIDVKDEVVSTSEKSDEPAAVKVSTSSEAGGSHAPLDKAFVKTISELDFVETGMEGEKNKFSVAVGLQFPTFKCCALKIGAKCEASSKGKASHFGGAVLKGRLSMTIGETEMKMKEGQMFYVPPSTNWRAINIGRTDCILYYWVGNW